jgi:hypothetical protein
MGFLTRLFLFLKPPDLLSMFNSAHRNPEVDGWSTFILKMFCVDIGVTDVSIPSSAPGSARNAGFVVRKRIQLYILLSVPGI